jgi:hypothetical protein
METIKEFFIFMGQTKKYWLIPILFVVLLLAGLIYLSSGTVVAPFVYTLF